MCKVLPECATGHWVQTGNCNEHVTQWSMTKLRPLRDDLAPEIRKLAEFLRQAFDQIGTGVRDYARDTHWEPGTISRFLSGERISRQDFIDMLLADAYPQHTPAEAEEERRRGRDLRNDALRVCNSRVAEAERLAQELSDAQHEIDLAALRERELSEALFQKQKKLDSLLEERRRMEASRSDSWPGRNEIESRQQQLDRIVKERERAQVEIESLRRDLGHEVAIREAAEKRRDELQATLDIANAELVRAGASAVEVDSYDPSRRLFAALREHRAQWGGILNLIAVAAVICVGPFYLGLVYHMLPKSLGAAQSLTIIALVIPGWLATRMRNLWHFESRSQLNNLLQMLAFIGCLFLVGYLV